MAKALNLGDGITVFTMQACPYCERAKQLLRTRGLEFQEVRVEMDDDPTWEALFQLSGLRTMPQIFNGRRVVGGYSDLAALDQKDQLSSLRGP